MSATLFGGGYTAFGGRSTAFGGGYTAFGAPLHGARVAEGTRFHSKGNLLQYESLC